MVNNRLKVPCHDAKMFTWKGRRGSVEASDFGPDREIASQVWNDSCDRGFEVKSHRTGHVVLFTFYEHIRDAEGEIAGWVYRGYGELDQGLTITVFND